jgi:hypothetical protein
MVHCKGNVAKLEGVNVVNGRTLGRTQAFSHISAAHFSCKMGMKGVFSAENRQFGAFFTSIQPETSVIISTVSNRKIDRKGRSL